jgi:hypothetical protein
MNWATTTWMNNGVTTSLSVVGGERSRGLPLSRLGLKNI